MHNLPEGAARPSATQGQLHRSALQRAERREGWVKCAELPRSVNKGFLRATGGPRSRVGGRARGPERKPSEGPRKRTRRPGGLAELGDGGFSRPGGSPGRGAGRRSPPGVVENSVPPGVVQ
jgi:hypothetical protein